MTLAALALPAQLSGASEAAPRALAQAPAVAPAPAASTLRFLEERVLSDPLDFVAQNRLAGECVRMMRETGDLAWLERARSAAGASLASVPGTQNAGGLTAMAVVEYESHHFAQARDLARHAYRVDSRNTMARTTEGDANLEMGDVAEAESIYRELASSARTPAILARLSRVAELHGHHEEAMKLMKSDPAALARDGVPAAEISWYQVRLGEMSFGTGDLEGAEAAYDRALKLSTDSYAALEHVAELRGAQGKIDDAAALYKRVIERTQRPEFEQVLGDLYASAGRIEEAKQWHAQALAGYLKSVEGGNAHYLHHLAGYYADSEENPVEALKWALKDMELRHSIYAYDALAWALYKNGDLDAAVDAVRKALARGTKDAHLLYHAGLIFSRAGRWEEGSSYLRESVAVNPRSNAFHMHR
ncbi:MAG: tetratricopeptide repeat protein [Acidobacteria bacterium]|nr:tetratricopeptide repeat protein [Acidobacteriota bacterium]